MGIGWDDAEIDLHVLEVHDQLVHCRRTKRSMHRDIFVSFIYGANELIQMRELQTEICRIAVTLEEENWLLMGDFNKVVDNSEVSGNIVTSSQAVKEFEHRLMDARLSTLPSQGLIFTWNNCSSGEEVSGRDLIECWAMKLGCAGGLTGII